MTAPDRSKSPASSFSSEGLPLAEDLHVGIDVSKASLEVALIGTEEKTSVSRTVPNTDEGFEQLLDWIEKQNDVNLETAPDRIHVCLEASGGYQRPVARFLHERGLTVSVLNPKRTSAYADS